MNERYQIAESSPYSRTQIDEILGLFKRSKSTLGDPRNTIKIVEYKDQQIVVKSFRNPNFINKIVYGYVRSSKAERSFEYAQKLINAGISTPRPIAFLEKLDILGLEDSYYLCDYFDADLTFRELVQDPDYPEGEIILRGFTHFTWLMHEQGILFKDHSPGNTLIKKIGDEYEYALVDLNRMEFGKLSRKQRLENFSRLTPKKPMVKTMAQEYAQLTGWNFDEVYSTMWAAVDEFQEGYWKKKRLKARVRGESMPPTWEERQLHLESE